MKRLIVGFVGLGLLALAGCGRLHVQGEALPAVEATQTSEFVLSGARLRAEASADSAASQGSTVSDNPLALLTPESVPQVTPSQSANCCGGSMVDLPNKADAEATAGVTPLYADVTVQIAPLPTSSRIQFQPGAATATVTGEVQPLQFDEWIVAAEAGQTLSARLSFTTGEATMIITGADGSGVDVYEDHATRFTGVLPTTQDYYIHVVGNYETPTDYTLTISH